MNVADKRLQMLGKGADKAGSSASMNLTAHLEAGDAPGHCALVGQATVIVSGKLAQFGSRLLVPVSDAMLTQFAGNFRNAAAAVPVAGAAPVAGAGADAVAGSAAAAAAAAAPEAGVAPAGQVQMPVPVPVPVPKQTELNALGLIWTVIKGWFAGLFGKKA
jgi:uncharacterized protein